MTRLLYTAGAAPRTGTRWEMISDQVMGGVSDGALSEEEVAGRRALRLTGAVSTENNGGFLQMALDLDPDGGVLDCSGWDGLALTVRGNGAAYNLHLRTDAVERPWQSYRQSFDAAAEWRELRLPWREMAPHRLEAPFDPGRLRRVGLVAIGRPFRADLALAELALYADLESGASSTP